MLDVSHPFFRPKWRRALIVAICFVWASVEQLEGAPVWALLFAAIGGYCTWNFFLSPAARALDRGEGE